MVRKYRNVKKVVVIVIAKKHKIRVGEVGVALAVQLSFKKKMVV